ANLANSHVHQNPHEPLVFAPVEQFVVRHVIIRVSRPAVDAPEITSVGDGHSQVCDRSSEFVNQRHSGPTSNPRFDTTSALRCPSRDNRRCRFSRHENENAQLRVRNRATSPKAHRTSNPLLSKTGGTSVSARTLSPMKPGIALEP